MLNFQGIVTITLTLFAVIDILGVLPVVISLREKHGTIHSERATLVSGMIMILFLFIGEELLKVVGVDLSSFALAGSVVIFFMALEMVLGREFFSSEGDPPGVGSIVPLAFPLVAGAGTLTTLISLRAAYHYLDIVIGIVLNLIIVFVVLKSSGRLSKILGPGGIAIIRRVFGIILLALAIKLFKTNLIV